MMLTRCGCTAAVWMCGWDAPGNRIGDTGAVALAKALESGQCQLKSLDLRCESMCLAASCAAGLRACFSLRLPCFRSVVCVRGLERAVGGALMLTRCGCTAAAWMCGWDAPDNGIGRVASEQVASALRVCAAACREAPLFAARCRLALAMGISSRLSEHSVLADCPLDCISRCGFFCSTRLAIRVLVAQSTERSGGAARDTTSAVVEEGVPPPHASGA